MVSTNSPPFFNNMNLYYGMSALRYYPGTPKIATSLHSYMSMIILVKRSSKYMVDEDVNYLDMYHLCGLPYAHVLPFIFPHLFYFIRFIVRSDSILCDF